MDTSRMKNEVVVLILCGQARHFVKVQKKLRADQSSFTIAVYHISKENFCIWINFPWMASRTSKSFTKPFPLEKQRKTKLSRPLLAPLKGKHLLQSAVGINVRMYAHSTGCNSTGIVLKVVYFIYTLHFRLGKIQSFSLLPFPVQTKNIH